VSHASHDQVVVASHAGRIYQRSSAEPDPKSTGIHGHPMSITSDYVREIFRGLKCGDGAAFFRHVADDVDWTVMGAHPFAGSYRSRAALVAGTFAKLAQVLPRGAQLHVEHLVVRDNQASVELHALVAATNGMWFDNHYRWIVCFREDKIVGVRGYPDSGVITQFSTGPAALSRETPPPSRRASAVADGLLSNAA
jgi:ketosteroid isomerase-like protein